MPRLTFYEVVDKVASLAMKVIVGMYGTKLDRRRPDAAFGAEMSATDRRELKKRLGDAGVTLACCWVGNPDLKRNSRRLFEFARDLGIETFDGEPPFEAFDMLEKLCDEYQVNLGIHNHPKPSPYWRPETLLKMFHGRSKRIGACCDTGHWARSSLNPVETLQKLQGRILTLDLKDVSEVGKWGKCVPLGTGQANINGILKELYRQRFRGVFGIEVDERPTDAELTQSIAFFNERAKQLVLSQ